MTVVHYELWSSYHGGLVELVASGTLPIEPTSSRSFPIPDLLAPNRYGITPVLIVKVIGSDSAYVELRRPETPASERTGEHVTIDAVPKMLIEALDGRVIIPVAHGGSFTVAQARPVS